jgi:hypothetical protein
MEKNFETYKSNLAAMHAAKQDNKTEWLDRLLLTRIQETLGSNPLPNVGDGDDGWGCSMEELDLLSFTFLVVEMPMLNNPVLSSTIYNDTSDYLVIFTRFYTKRSSIPRLVRMCRPRTCWSCWPL